MSIHLATARLGLIDRARGTRILRHRRSYDRSQWLSVADLESLQARKLESLLAGIRKTVPFYRRLAASGITGSTGSSPFEDLRRLPVSLKETIRQAPADFQDGATDLRTFVRHTGGSTGTPFAFIVDEPAMSGQWAGLFRAWEWNGYRIGDRMVTVGGGSVAPAGGGGLKHRVYNLLRNNLPIAAASLDESGLSAALQVLSQARPAMVYGYPALIHALAVAAVRQGMRLPTPRAVVTTSEMLFPGQRSVISEAFGAPVFDQYGCNEVNLVASECDRHDGWHYAMEASFVEILDEHGDPVPTGQVGRIVATSLDNRTMPFVRYDTGDLGALDPSPCSCGRGLIRLRSLKGRSRDLIRARDGRLVHGVIFNDLMLDYPWVDRYQLIQLDSIRLRAILACANPGSADQQSKLKDSLSRITGLDVALALNEPFDVTSGLKARVIVSQLEKADGS